MKKLSYIFIIVLFGAFSAVAGDNAVEVGAGMSERFEDAIAPQIQKAKATLDSTKGKFLAGLKNSDLYLTIRIADGRGNVEQVFVKAFFWNDGNVIGKISNTPMKVEGYKKGQSMTFSESDILDWTILHKDGTEEGNFIGKFVDKLYGNSPKAAK